MGQRAALARTFGCARVVYNDALAARKDARKGGLPYPKSADLQKLVITAAPVPLAASCMTVTSMLLATSWPPGRRTG
ncbi:helix-turn-helix domain-containing protein [Kitasatospora sp. NPDC001159]